MPIALCNSIQLFSAKVGQFYTVYMDVSLEAWSLQDYYCQCFWLKFAVSIDDLCWFHPRTNTFHSRIYFMKPTQKDVFIDDLFLHITNRTTITFQHLKCIHSCVCVYIYTHTFISNIIYPRVSKPIGRRHIQSTTLTCIFVYNYMRIEAGRSHFDL